MRRMNCVFGLALVALVGNACTSPAALGEEKGSTASHLESGRYHPDEAAPQQHDQWSCSVYTTTWMLRATGTDQTWDSVSSYMQSKGRVTEASGLSDASGAGLADTLRELAGGNPDIGSTGAASFDDVAARAGRMAVGIGGRAWNHWSGVRSYDAAADVLVLANSAPGYRGVSGTMTRDDFARLGGMSMVWIDYGDGASSHSPEATPPPFVAAARPASDPFPALLVRTSIAADVYITQCSAEEDAERVWQTDGTSPDASTFWAPPKYPQEAKTSCGAPGPDGVHPLVFRSVLAGELGGAWIVECSGNGDGVQRVYRVDDEVDGHPSASFLYPEPNADCD